jgi:hypothetical protein
MGWSCQVNEKPFEDLKHCTAALTRGVVKFAQAPLGVLGAMQRDGGTVVQVES